MCRHNKHLYLTFLMVQEGKLNAREAEGSDAFPQTADQAVHLKCDPNVAECAHSPKQVNIQVKTTVLLNLKSRGTSYLIHSNPIIL